MVNGSHPWPSLPQAKKAFAAGCLPPVLRQQDGRMA